ncbi:hypothetical protein N2E09_04415 [Leuconostoc citreum]|uniref:hypothetical protein n=1 Tax=Leuconostoc citreum TaxID=33964 RepID=UPI0032DF8645
MTFDEAVEELKTLSKNGADTWYGDNLEKRTHVKGHIESGSVEMLIYQLRKEYVPTIEMTQRQKDLLLHYKQHSWFSLFLGKLNDPYNEIYRSLPDLSCFDNWGTAKERENEILSAWLHPETIKVIGEINDTATSSGN